ncbi:hypothetical protein AQUCO_02200163v1 [Aquilegia coerulea]|uniref:DYW domain-containing protein n=1 Tax=Aquilegia coerulea TaxID=218851 RepID=A0A2G5DDE2_AQUCA|nr:hypothetical protein AQUCO_02200163v1 [Aquilegia coerulea]
MFISFIKSACKFKNKYSNRCDSFNTEADSVIYLSLSLSLSLSLKLALQHNNHRKLTTLLLKCAGKLSIKQLLQIQAQVITYAPPYLNTNIIAVKLIGISASHAKLRHASLIFTQLTNPNVYAYNALLKAFAQHNDWNQTLSFFNYQLSSPTAPSPDEYTFTSVIKACAGLHSLSDGFKVHAFITKTGHQGNLFVQNSLMDMYFKFGFAEIAYELFDEMTVRDVVSWNTLVSGYVLSGDVEKARRVFDMMVEKSLVTWSAMITGYVRSGDVDAAREIFDRMPDRNVISWNAMIAGYAQNEKYADAIDLFWQMLRVSGFGPNDVTFVNVLSACAHVGALDLGKWIDQYIKRNGMELNLFLGNALADMFSKCGCLAEARRVFNEMQVRDVITWTIIISGLATHGHANESFDHFYDMLECGIKPNEITFMGILSACTHAGLVEEGLKFFNQIDKVYGISPTIEHYGCVVDLLSRAGRLNEAEDLINSMPMKPNVIVWGALLGGCRIYKDVERGERVVQHILKLDSGHSGSYVYLANVYASMGRLDAAASCRLRMRESGVTKTPGYSWIEHGHTIHEFFMGDRSHPQTDQIYSMISELESRMKLAGYRPNTGLVVHSVDEEEKEDVLSTHSEKLAIAFGLINTREGATIRVMKNLRVCTDCHEATKVISKIVNREIIVRDRSRFHHFKDGWCSCNDYW